MHDSLEPMADGHDITGVSLHKGFPNPAADNFMAGRRGLALDLNQLLIRHPTSTFMFRIRGHTWAEQGVFDGDIAIIDRALQASPYDIVMVWLDENFELHRRNQVTENQHIWGVVSAIIHPRQQGDS